MKLTSSEEIILTSCWFILSFSVAPYGTHVICGCHTDLVLKSDQKVADDELVVSFDVVSLFTSIPIDMTIDIVQRKLEGSDDWRSHTQLTKAQVLDLLSFLLHSSYFVFEGTQYHQVSGCAMGSPVNAVNAELVMQEVEEKALETSPVQPKWWLLCR
ncbi:hypothetical protein ACROYT_G025089 [Oculina patagonica]